MQNLRKPATVGYASKSRAGLSVSLNPVKLCKTLKFVESATAALVAVMTALSHAWLLYLMKPVSRQYKRLGLKDDPDVNLKFESFI